MSGHEFLQVDAFTDRPLEGNPCAVVLGADDLDEVTMQAIALEMNLSETAFLLESDSADFRARYFTPAEEVPLAGHPTIAAARALVDTGRIASGTPRFLLELQVGPIPVDLSWDGDRLLRATMSQKKPTFLDVYDSHRVLPAFGLSPDDLLQGVPIQTVSTGTPQLMIALTGRDALSRIRLDPLALGELRAEGDFFSPHLFCMEGFTPAGRTSARHFGSPPDTFEDPFTGSATGGMAAYLWRFGLIEAPVFLAEQGHAMGRPGRAHVEVIGSPDDIETVKVGGAAVTILRGRLEI